MSENALVKNVGIPGFQELWNRQELVQTRNAEAHIGTGQEKIPFKLMMEKLKNAVQFERQWNFVNSVDRFPITSNPLILINRRQKVPQEMKVREPTTFIPNISTILYYTILCMYIHNHTYIQTLKRGSKKNGAYLFG